jgi:hypothetical protein
MQLSLTTDVLAWWGAIVATLVLFWDIIKWRREGVHLSVTIKGIEIPAGAGVRCEIRNRGGKATTVSEVMLVTRPGNLMARLFGISMSTRYLSSTAPEMNLPILLAPGAEWIGTYYFPDARLTLAVDDDYRELLKQGKLYYKVRFSHTDRCVKGRVKPEGILDMLG